MRRITVRFWSVHVDDKPHRARINTVIPIGGNTEDNADLDKPVQYSLSTKRGAHQPCGLLRLPIEFINDVLAYLDTPDALTWLQVCDRVAIMKTWHHTEVLWAGNWFIKLYREIGPNPQLLRAPHETYQTAYQRHAQQFQQIPTSIHSLADVHRLFEQYPNYHVRRLIHEASIDQILGQLTPYLVVLHNQLQLHSKSSELVMQRLLNQDGLFLRFFKNCQDLMDARQWFTLQWPTIMHKVLHHDQLFIEIFKERSANTDPVIAVFGEYAHRIVDKMCAQPHVFMKIIRSKARLTSFTACFEGLHYEQYRLNEKYRQFYEGAPARMIDFKITALGPWLKIRDWTEKRCAMPNIMLID